jgi:hypothetical protein
MFARPLAKLVLASAVSAAALSAGLIPSLAAEPAEVANRLKELMAGQGATLSWASIDDADADVVLRGVTVKDSTNPETIALGDITLDGIEEAANGDYIVETLSMPKYETVSEGATITVEGVSMSGAVLPSPTSTDIVSQSGFFDSLDIDTINVARTASRSST